MLTDLFIKNFAIIDNLHISFQSGLNILTGETGAGKSIIIDAVNLVMGGRASTDLIRTGEDEASVEALFDLGGVTELCRQLVDNGIDCNGELLVRRIIARSGKNRVFLNGSLSTLAQLTDISRRLINIYGQHESQTLLKPENHQLLLDGCGGLENARGAFATLFAEYRSLREQLARLTAGDREMAQRIDLLSFQSDEIGKAALQAGEEEMLGQERNLLAHAEKLLLKTQTAYDLLYGGEPAILGALGGALAAIHDAGTIDSSLLQLHDAVQGAMLQLEDAALTLRDYAARVEVDPARLQAVDDRLDLISRLKRKYGATVAEIISFKEQIDLDLARLSNLSRSREDLELQLETVQERMGTAGEGLSSQRVKAAARMQQSMQEELRQLAMANAGFIASIELLSEPRETGMDRVEFLFSPNPGEAPKPLSKIASGGELSRLMLALKQIHPESDVPTLVFDEVDTGISGAVSALVGKKLKKVACTQQVLCITHLPQVAACADHHFIVKKEVAGGRTVTGAALLDEPGRVAELARLLAGERITETTMQHAQEMIDHARLPGI